jgi:hypothetical protein
MHAIDIHANPDAEELGHSNFRIPSTFVGGPHYANHKCQQVLTCAAKFGVDNMLFVTATFNEDWPVVDELLGAQSRTRATTVRLLAPSCCNFQV